LAREVGYEGFGSVPLLSESLFGNWFVLRSYNPLAKMHFGGSPAQPTEGYASRLNAAAKMMLNLPNASSALRQFNCKVASLFRRVRIPDHNFKVSRARPNAHTPNGGKNLVDEHVEALKA